MTAERFAASDYLGTIRGRAGFDPKATFVPGASMSGVGGWV